MYIVCTINKMVDKIKVMIGLMALIMCRDISSIEFF